VLTLGKLKSNVAERAETISAASDVQPGDGQQQSQMQLQIDDDQVLVSYSTTARVWGSAEEINVDFARTIASIEAAQHGEAEDRHAGGAKPVGGQVFSDRVGTSCDTVRADIRDVGSWTSVNAA